ncbi:hypothetical protein [Oxalobacter aliiformigenes]|uniref:hypothetical protein n=1 Tax=Oxalobacter aliiformigenes TaxID=2946593 RepID=UPI0022AF2E6B|nr:hypothetical protein [Oxalobacter aliiformigenes]WAV92346.1 hypothetical protein NB641_05925 [Oxalobacter aliiformigenes]
MSRFFSLLSGSRKQEAGSRKQEAGSRKQEAGSRKQEAGSRKQEAGSRKQEAGSRKQEAGSRKQEAGSRKQGNIIPDSPPHSDNGTGRLPRSLHRHKNGTSPRKPPHPIHSLY